jgi:hypothetical protein
MTTVSIKPKSGRLPELSRNFFWTSRPRKADLDLLAEYRAMQGFKKEPAKLLTTEVGNNKLAKGKGLYTVGLNLQPANQSGWNMCGASTFECRLFCLVYTGHNQRNSSYRARAYRTALLMEHPNVFARLLASELWALRRLKGGLALRMNLLSDLDFHRGLWSDVINEAIGPDSRRYEYTKVKSYFQDTSAKRKVHFTYSARSEKLDPLDGDFIQGILANGYSIAVISRTIPSAAMHGYPVVNGDLNDRRYEDPKGCFVILKPKGKLAKSNSPFIYNLTK